jgi:hypothetical protein
MVDVTWLKTSSEGVKGEGLVFVVVVKKRETQGEEPATEETWEGEGML